jgi:hypothetical protein
LFVPKQGGTLSDEQEIREAVDEAKDSKVFNIVNILQERSYPKQVIEIFLDEENSYKASMVKQQLEELDKKTGTKGVTAQQKEKRDSLIAEFELLSEKISESKYSFHISGISEGRREKLIAEATKKYPIEYEKSAELSALLGSSNGPQEKASPQRDQLFTDFLWREQIQKIVDPDGNEQSDLAYGDIRSLRENLPLSSSAKINNAIEKIRTATAVFMMETGEDFLAKP